MVLEDLERCRPNPEWDTAYDPISSIQVMKLKWTLDHLLAFDPNSDATKNMDNFPSDINLSGTIDAHLILMETKAVVPPDLMAKVQSNTKLIPKPPSPSSSHPVIGTLIQTQKTHCMAQYYLTNMAINIPIIVNPSLDFIKAQIISVNQVCQSIINSLPSEYETQLRQRIEQSAILINKAIRETLLTEHNNTTPDTVFTFEQIPIKEALFNILDSNKEIMRHVSRNYTGQDTNLLSQEFPS